MPSRKRSYCEATIESKTCPECGGVMMITAMEFGHMHSEADENKMEWWCERCEYTQPLAVS